MATASDIQNAIGQKILATLLFSALCYSTAATAKPKDITAALQPLVTQHSACLLNAISKSSENNPSYKPSLLNLQNKCLESRMELNEKLSIGAVKKFEVNFLKNFALVKAGKVKPPLRVKDKIVDLE